MQSHPGNFQELHCSYLLQALGSALRQWRNHKAMFSGKSLRDGFCIEQDKHSWSYL